MTSPKFKIPDHLKLCSFGPILMLTFKALENLPIVYGSFLRHGGVSKGATASLNLGSPTFDALENLKTNRKLLLSALGKKHCYFLNQRHGTVLHEGLYPNETILKSGDGLYTNVPGLVLLIRHADCQGAVFYDPVHRVIANIHCGWRGLVANIYKVTVNKLKQKYGSRPEDLIVCITPSLGPCHVEYKTYEKIFPKSFQEFSNGSSHFDFWKIATHQLCTLGVSESNIHIAGICTYCYPEDFFSFRRDRISANNASVIFLKDQP